MATSALKGLVLIVWISMYFLGIASCQQLDIQAVTPSGYLAGHPNTFLATSNQVASSLLGSGTPVLFWGAIPASAVRDVCDAIVQQGTMFFDAYIRGSWATDERLALQVEATGGCHAAPDESGTEFVFSDNYGRRSAMVCPNGAGAIGCGVYMTGEDINELYHKGVSSNFNLHSRMNYTITDCQSGARDGAIGGAITGVITSKDCWALGPLSPFCAAGVIGAVSMLGALAGCVKSCFPANAMAELVTGELVPMDKLHIGHKVAVLKDGKKGFEDVYAFGHKEMDVVSEFLQIQMHVVSNVNVAKKEMTLEISSLHFVPTLTSTRNDIHYKRAMDIEVGDLLLALKMYNEEDNILILYEVTMVATVVRKGLYNPFTLGGTIIVDGVVASTHSDWFLDPLFDQLGIAHLLPQAYQLLLLPVRCIYYLLGPHIYTAVYNWLDGTIDIADTGTKYGSDVAIATATIFFVAIIKTFIV